MVKRKRSLRHGRSGDPRKREADERARAQAEATPELDQEVEAVLDSGHPIDIAMLASSLIAGLDPGELGPGDDGPELPPPAEFVRMFLDSEKQQLQILAWTVAQLLADARLQTEVAAALAPGTVPDWLAPLAHPEVVAAWQTTDPLRDSTDVVVSLRVGTEDLTVIGLIDFNTDGALRDGFAIPAPLTEFQAAFTAGAETGMTSRDLSAADARAWLSEAIATGRLLQLPFTSDSWPQARPLMEWAVRQCPSGGQGWRRRLWSVDEVAEVIAEFATSPAGAVVADTPDRAVLTDALHLLARQTQADPLLLSAVRLEMGLGYLWATSLHHDLDRLLALPEALAPYVRWAHAQRGIPADDTDEALATIARLRSEFVRDVVEVSGLEGDEV